ncbi:MAG: thiamine pyrophosphate-dependent dehydrogenase E1 component subunit alpha [Candidatus Omnitrophica bacterium]|nr:thiamine pyrophosphate-dependent dehydrogenase E1 component subunit alpha [Candidatus Omnitrophota bacterium]MBD3269679.1 thiamine pyrophosphate-dependent dehydrogenase E1 component subunit alpha [Candidatus Omnitrophota bacterium]
MEKNKKIAKNYKGIPALILRNLLYTMVKIRLVEENISNLYHKHEMRCPMHLCTGQEAVSTGVCLNLKKGDVSFSSHRAHGYYIGRGGSLKFLMAEFFGKNAGCAKGKGGSQHLVCSDVGLLGSSAIVGGTLPICVGAGLAIKMIKKRSVALVNFGDGAADEGVLYESLNFAALKKLPVVFICENNFYATHAHQSVRQARDNIYLKARAFGVSSVRVDGNNVLEVFKAGRNAVAAARKGKGPHLVECRTYRWLEHVGPDYDYNLGYRSKKEVDKWKNKCPIKKFSEFLLKEKLIRKQEIDNIYKGIKEEIEEALKFAKKSPFPLYSELTKDVYYI